MYEGIDAHNFVFMPLCSDSSLCANRNLLKKREVRNCSQRIAAFYSKLSVDKKLFITPFNKKGVSVW